MNKIRLACLAVLYLANEAAGKAQDLFLGNDRITPPPAEGLHWVQLSPFGDFANSNGGQRVIQRFTHEDGDTIANAFNKGLGKTKGQPMGMPFYIGHPDHASFKGKPGHTDVASKGRGVKMETRFDPSCGICNAFAAGDNEAEPCPDHGLFVGMEWSAAGKEIVNSKQFHGHSVNWGAVPDGKENGVQIYRPIKVKSAGFTNEPNIPVKPASLANATSDGNDMGLKSIAPGRLKILAGFKDDEDKTVEQCIAALESVRSVGEGNKSNETEAIEAERDWIMLVNAEAMKGDTDADSFIQKLHERMGTDPKDGIAALETALEPKLQSADKVDEVKKRTKAMRAAYAAHDKARSDLETACANERKARAKATVDLLVLQRKLTIDAAPALLEKLTAKDANFDEIANAVGHAGRKVHSVDLPNAHASTIATEQERRLKQEGMIAARQKDFPNENYGDSYAAVMATPEGQQLFAQMKRSETQE